MSSSAAIRDCSDDKKVDGVEAEEPPETDWPEATEAAEEVMRWDGV